MKGIIQNDIPKYKKKSQKKGLKRSNHKHDYVDCVIGVKCGTSLLFKVSEVCKICGYIGNDTADYKNRFPFGLTFYRLSNPDKEIDISKFYGLPFFVVDYNDKFINWENAKTFTKDEMANFSVFSEKN